MQYEFSIIIPARNEEFLSLTIENILKNKRGKTEIIVGLDGNWAEPAIQDHPDVTILYYPESIGQRAIANQCVRLSSAKYIMKIDAHCVVDEGFDVKMMNEMKDNYTMIPRMYNLHGFDWVCTKCGFRKYQGPTVKCEKCGSVMKRDIKWQPRFRRMSEFYRFNTDLKFQYHSIRKKQVPKEDMIVETMSSQGSCFMLTRDKWWELDICDEEHGSWGQQGTEVACKTWLSGGRLLTNRKTWYSHLFRTQGADFGFPYPISGNQVARARKYSKDLFLNNKWDKAIHTFGWLIKKFDAPEWHKKEIITFTDNRIEDSVAIPCQKQMMKGGLPIINVSLKPMKFGKNIVLDLERGYLTLFKQILAGLEASKADIVFLCDHDLLYHPSHFDFIPPRDDVFYYDLNVWRVRLDDGLAIHYDARQSNMLCAYREMMVSNYRKRVKFVEEKGWTTRLGFEPGTQKRNDAIDKFGADHWWAEYPSIDIRHGKNLTRSRWKPSDFRNGIRSCPNWVQSDSIKGWGVIKNRFKELLSLI